MCDCLSFKTVGRKWQKPVLGHAISIIHGTDGFGESLKKP